MLEVRSDELTLTYRVEQWSENLGRWIPTGIEGDSLADVLAALRAVLRDDPTDPLHDPDSRRIVECRETVVPWPGGAADATT